MSFIAAYLYDKVMAETEAACLQEWRESLLSDVSGHVLEIGSGTGANLPFYDLNRVQLTLCEPDAIMRKQLISKVKAYDAQRIQISTDGAEMIQAGDNELDCVVSTLVCCSVKHLEQALKEIKRVLKPGGRFIFLEHVAAEQGTRRRTWQNIMNPIWKVVAGNCHLNRNTCQAIEDVGFKIDTLTSESMRKAMPLVRPTIRGVAIKPDDV